MWLLLSMLAVYLLVRVWRLTRQVAALESRLRALEGRPTVRRGAITTSPEAGPQLDAATSIDAAPEVGELHGREPVPGAIAAAASQARETAAPAPKPIPERVPAPAPVPRPALAAPPPGAPRAPAGTSLEELIGVRLYVWVGAFALFLAGAFLVKLGIDRGWITPEVRVALAVVFGTALIVTADWLRPSADRASAALSAAGVGVLFAGFFAAASVYQMIPAVAGFFLMALTALMAVGLSLRHGVIVGVVGLLGGYLTPMLVSTDAAGNEPFLTLYLLLLLAGVLGASRQREWWPVAALGLLGSFGWSVALVSGTPTAISTVCGCALAAAAALSYILSAPKPDLHLGSHGVPDVAWSDAGAMLGALLLVALAVDVEAAVPVPWLFMGALGAAGIALGRGRADREVVPWTAAAATALVIVAWSAGSTITAMGPSHAIAVVAALGILHAAGAYAALWGSKRPALWAGLAAAAAVGYFLAAFLVALAFAPHGVADPTHWGGVAAVLAGVSIGSIALVLSRGRRGDDTNGTVGALAAAAAAFGALAVALAASREWFAVAWSLELAAVTWLALRTGLPSLRRLAWPLGAVVAFDLLDPFIARDPGGVPIANWLLYGYGVPIAAFSVAAWHAHRDGDGKLATALQWGALFLGFVMLTLQIRHAFTGTALRTWPPAPFVAAGTFSIAWLGYGLALRRAARRWPLQCLRLGGLGAIALGLYGAVAVTAFVANPLWSHASVGAMRMVNWLLYAFGVSAALALLADRELRDGSRVERSIAAAAGLVGMGMLFLLVTLEVRQAFRGSVLSVGVLTTAENYAYSLAWMLMGSMLLVVGVQARSRLARWASLPIMLLTVCKVFLYDVAAIGDLFRVLSFLGLGLSLVALGWVYQRFVFGRGAP